MSYLGPSLRRTARRAQRAWRRVLVALVLSLLVNAFVLEQMNAHWRLTPVTVAPKRDVVLAPLSASEWEANRAVAKGQPSMSPRPPAVAQTTPPPTPPPPPRNVPGQVVDVQPSKNDTPPKDSRFVSEQNSTVEKETRSRDARAGYENTLAKKSSPDAVKAQPAPPTPPAVAAAPPAPKQGGKASGQGPRAGPSSTTQPAPPSEAARDRLALLNRGELRNPLKAPLTPVPPPRTGEGATENGDGRPRSAGADEQGATGTAAPVGRLDLRPSASAYEKLAGGPAPDKLDGVEEGEGTFLNTREWKYAGYFNRIKQAVASQWDPSTAMGARDPTGGRFSHKDWDTLVMVRLDSGGVLKKVTVARGSGLEFLDRLAIEAFEKAQPFANPPPGLADGNGEIAFSFGFYVQMGGSGMRVFRQQH